MGIPFLLILTCFADNNNDSLKYMNW